MLAFWQLVVIVLNVLEGTFGGFSSERCLVVVAEYLPDDHAKRPQIRSEPNQWLLALDRLRWHVVLRSNQILILLKLGGQDKSWSGF